jgi:prepilin-type processing-associated H-X9-DG protein
MRSTVGWLAALVCLGWASSCQVPLGRTVSPYVFEKAEYEVRAPAEATLGEVRADLVVRAHEADLRIPLLPRDVALQRWQAAGAEVLAEAGGYVLCVREPGTYRLTADFLLPRASPSPGVERIVVPVQIATSSAMTVVLPAGTGEFTVSPPAVVLEDKTAGAERRVRLLAPAAERVSLVWEKKAGAAEREAAFLARVDSVFQIGRGLIIRDEPIVCRVQRGGIRSLRLEMPAGVLVRRVVGADVLRWRVEEGGRAAEVTFARTVKDETRLAVRAEQSLAADQAALAISPVVLVGAGLQEGSLRLEPAKDLILNETAVVGAARSSEAAPAEARSLDYSYARLPASVTVEIVDREPKVAVATEVLAVIEAGVLTLETHLHYNVEMREIRSVSIGIPAGSTVLAVAGQGVRDWETAGGDRLIVRFADAVLGKADVVVRLQDNLRVMNGIAIPRLQPTEVHSEEGVIGVSAGEGVQLRHHGATLTEQVDVTALPEWIQKGGAKLGYRYRQPGGTLSVSTERIEPRVTAMVLDTVELEQDVLLRTFQADLQVEQAEVFEVVLRMPAGLTPLRVQGEAVADWQLKPAAENAKADLIINLKKGQLGPVSFALEMSQIADYQRPVAIESIDLVGMRRVEGGLLVVPRADIRLKPAGETGLQAQPAGEVRGVVPAGDRQTPLPADSVGYRYSGPWSLGLGVERLEAQIAATAVTLLRLRHGQVSAETCFECNIQNAGVSVLRVRLPEGAVNSWVDGPGISSRRLTGDTWRIVLDQRRRGIYRFRLTYDRLVVGDQTEVIHREAEVLGTVSQKGFILVGKEKPDIEISAATDGLVRPVETDAVPGWHGIGVDVPLFRTFEYSGLEWRLALDVRLLGSAEVLQVRASDCFLQTLLARDGSAVTFMTLTVENAGRQFAEIRLPEGRVLWGAYVDGRPVKPVESGEPQTYLIPLLGQGQTGETFELTAVYTERYAPLAGRTADLAFTSPPVDVPTGSMTWAVYMPPEYRVMPEIWKRVGNMQLIYEPADASEPVTQELFGQDATRLERAWPLVRPYVMALVWVVVVLAGVAAAALAGYVALKVAWRVLFPAAGRTIKFVWQRPALRWAAIIIPVLLVMIVAGAALLMPAVHFVRGEASSTRCLRNIYHVGSALREYEAKHGNYPDSPEALVDEGLIDREALKNEGFANAIFDYRAGGKKAADLPASGVLAYAESEDGFNVLYNDGHVEWRNKGEMRDLAAQLYRQGDVDANVVREDLKLDEEVNESAKQYDEAKRLKGRSRANLDQLVGKDIQARLQQKVADRYGVKAESDRASGAAEGEADEGQQVAQRALEAQTNELLAQAQGKAGVKVTVAAPKPSAAPPAPAEEPAALPPVAPPPQDAAQEGPVTAEPEKPAEFWKPWVPEDTTAAVFGKVEQGRSKGSLPIGLELPEVSRAPYLFGSVFTGSGLGTFELTAARAGTGYTSYSIAGAAAVGLALVAGRLGLAWKKNRGAKAHA